MPDSGSRSRVSFARRASCLAIAWLLGCEHASPGPLRDVDAIPVLTATLIKPCGAPGGFERVHSGFMSTKQTNLPLYIGTDLELALPQVRQWLHREFGAATEELEFGTIRFNVDSHGQGSLILKQKYRGIDTPGSLILESTNSKQFAFVELWSLVPTRDPPSRVIPASTAEAAARKELARTPNAMTRIGEGDQLVLEYFTVSDAGALKMPTATDDHARVDAFWGFRGWFDRFPHEPFVNARTGAVIFSVCGTSDDFDEK